ncbi:unnamed protein product [Larinioides sclopetarius]|uniref:Uncharacterized protein n=1 Tax=Larinioides sclopetarius TaxID=280406 RepID=A0AAV2AY93_9ARAC
MAKKKKQTKNAKKKINDLYIHISKEESKAHVFRSASRNCRMYLLKYGSYTMLTPTEHIVYKYFSAASWSKLF